MRLGGLRSTPKQNGLAKWGGRTGVAKTYCAADDGTEWKVYRPGWCASGWLGADPDPTGGRAVCRSAPNNAPPLLISINMQPTKLKTRLAQREPQQAEESPPPCEFAPPTSNGLHL